MSEPTREELKNEIENGPLAGDLAAFWNDVFPKEPEPPAVERPAGEYEPTNPAWVAWQTRQRWERIQNRAGILKPDPAFEIRKILIERGRADELGWGRDWPFELVVAAKGKTPKEAMPPGPPPLPRLSKTPGTPSSFRPEPTVGLTAPPDMPEQIVRFHRIRFELMHQSDRGAAIIAAAYVDNALEKAIKTRLLDLQLPKKSSVHARLFTGYGPLQSFSARIDMAFALQLIGEHSYRDLTVIRGIRNDFAHQLDLDSTAEGLTFQTPSVIDRCDDLWTPKNDYYARHGATWLKDADLAHARGRYVFAAFQISQWVGNAVGHWQTLDRSISKHGLSLVPQPC